MDPAVIPSTVHRIWIGPHRMPAEYVAHARAWENLGYVVHDWSEDELWQVAVSDETRAALEDIAANGTNPGGGLESVARWVQMADVWGYELVREFGGIYANTDIEPLRRLPLDGLDAFVVAEDGQFLSNALMGAVADHSFYRAVSKALPLRLAEDRWVEMNRSTGPHLLTWAWESLMRPVVRLDPVPFFPVSFNDEHNRGPVGDGYYVDHHWGHKHPELLR